MAAGADALDNEGRVRNFVGGVLPDARREVLVPHARYLRDLTTPRAPDVVVRLRVQVVADRRLRPALGLDDAISSSTESAW